MISVYEGCYSMIFIRIIIIIMKTEKKRKRAGEEEEETNRKKRKKERGEEKELDVDIVVELCIYHLLLSSQIRIERD